MNQHKHIEIYTDGSCNHIHKTGAWAAVVLINNKKIVLSGVELDTTHQRMELFALIKSFEYIQSEGKEQRVLVYTDSDYVINLDRRIDKLRKTKYISGKGNAIANSDLIERLFQQRELIDAEIFKIESHQKKSETANYNREADMLARKLVRQQIEEKTRSAQ